jgi:hypothetical protein
VICFLVALGAGHKAPQGGAMHGINISSNPGPGWCPDKPDGLGQTERHH